MMDTPQSHHRRHDDSALPSKNMHSIAIARMPKYSNSDIVNLKPAICAVPCESLISYGIKHCQHTTKHFPAFKLEGEATLWRKCVNLPRRSVCKYNYTPFFRKCQQKKRVISYPKAIERRIIISKTAKILTKNTNNNTIYFSRFGIVCADAIFVSGH